MNNPNSNTIIGALVIVAALFLLFGGGALTGGFLDGPHGGGWMPGNEWMTNRTWMWTPTILTLGIGILLGWVLFRKQT